MRRCWFYKILLSHSAVLSHVKAVLVTLSQVPVCIANQERLGRGTTDLQ